MKTSTLGMTAGTSKPKTFKNLNLNVTQQAAKASGPPKTTTGVRGSLTLIQGNTRVTKPVGAAAAPVPVNTPSLRKEKGEEFDVSLVPSGKSAVWGAAETSSTKAGTNDASASSNKVTSWADIDSDDDDDGVVDRPVSVTTFPRSSRENDVHLSVSSHDTHSMQHDDRRDHRSDSFDERQGGQRSSSWHRDNSDSRNNTQFSNNHTESSNGNRQDYRQNYMNDNRHAGDDRQMNQWRNNGMSRANAMPPPPPPPMDSIEAARQEREQLEMKKKYQEEQKQLKKRQLELDAEMRANGLDPDFYRGGPIPASASRHTDNRMSAFNSTNNNNNNNNTDERDRWERGARQLPPPPAQPIVAASAPIHVSKIQTRDRSECGAAIVEPPRQNENRSFRQLFAGAEVEVEKPQVEAAHSRDRLYSDDYDERAMRGGLKVNAENMDRCEKATSKPKMLFDPKSNRMVGLTPAAPVKSAAKAAAAKPAPVVEKKVVKKAEDVVKAAVPIIVIEHSEPAPVPAAPAVSSDTSQSLQQVDATEFKPLVLVRPRSVSEEKEKLEKIMAAAALSSANSGARAKSTANGTATQHSSNPNPDTHTGNENPVSNEASRKARLKEKAERGPRTAGLLFRYNKSGEIEVVLSERAKQGGVASRRDAASEQGAAKKAAKAPPVADKETPKETPKETQKETPKETPKEAPAKRGKKSAASKKPQPQPAPAPTT